MADNLNCHCSCGETRFNVSGVPLLRSFCHCTICQAQHQAPFADITVFRAKDVIIPNEKNIAFKTHQFPPILKRGKCASCGGGTLEYLKIFPMPKFIIVPSESITDKALVPEPTNHIFYETRVADIQDELPKYSGYVKSQLAFGQALIASWLGGKVNRHFF